MGASFLAMLPVLLSAILLFNGSEIIDGKSFLIINDLSEPDGFYGANKYIAHPYDMYNFN